MKKYLTLSALLLTPCVARADGIAPLAAFYLDIPLLILLIPIALIEGIYLFRKLRYCGFWRMFFLSFVANVITTLIGCLLVPIFLIGDIVLLISVDGCLEGCYGLEELGFPLNLLLGWGVILLPAILLFWISYNLEYKYISRFFGKKKIEADEHKTKKAVFIANAITYFLITAFLLFADTWHMMNWSNSHWKPTPACGIEQPLRGFKWGPLPPADIVEKRGECFECDYADGYIMTTKAECDKCPGRHYTGKTCVINECPPDKPVRSGYLGEKDFFCESCDNEYLPNAINTDEKCDKCLHHSRYWRDEDGKCRWHEE